MIFYRLQSDGENEKIPPLSKKINTVRVPLCVNFRLKSTWKIINITTFAANFPIDLVSLFGTFMRLTHKNYLVGTMWTAASGLVSSSCPSPVRTRLCAGSRAPWTRPTGHSTTGRGHTPVRHTASDYVLS